MFSKNKGISFLITKAVAMILVAIIASSFICVNAEDTSLSQDKLVLGDVDMNGNLTTFDALFILKYLSKLTILGGDSLKLADYDNDGSVSTYDALIILKNLAGLNGDRQTLPLATGDFIQTWICEGWNASAWDKHLDELSSAGIDTVILQGTVFRNKEDKFTSTMYESEYVKARPEEQADNYIARDVVNNLLKSAERKGFKVFIGLNDSDSWWDENLQRNPEWRAKDVEIAGAIAKEMYDLYKNKYPNAFYGWYYVHEMYSQYKGLEAPWSTLMNDTIAKLNEIDPTLPLMFSPFFSTGNNTSPDQNGRSWSYFLKNTNFRKGDIFAPQDSYGVSGFSLDYIRKSFVLMKEAADQNENVEFWVNVENFTKKGPAEVTRYIQQLNLASEFAKNIITFSYTHYYNDNTNGEDYNNKYDLDYKAFRKRVLEQNELMK